MSSKWNKSKCLTEAKRFETRTQWAKGSGTSYNIAAENGWLKDCSAHMVQKIKPNGHWTKSNCRSEAQKFTSRSDWARRSGTSYNTALENGWLEECCAHMKPIIKPMGYWTKARCQEEAKKYTCSSEWQRGSGSSYVKAKEMGWMKDCSKHFTARKKPNGYWTMETCKQEAQKYDTKATFEVGSRGAYHSALDHGWMGEVCAHMENKMRYDGYSIEELEAEAKKYQTRRDFRAANEKMVLWAQRHGLMDKICGHMRLIGNRKKRQLYAFEHPDNTVYVGHSGDAYYRYEQHIHHSKPTKTALVLRAKKKQFGEKQVWKVFPGWFSEEEAAKEERRLYEQYKKDGWILLNTESALGALGGTTTKWTLEECIKVSRKCKKRSEIQQRYPSAYNAIRENGWRKQCYAHMGKSKITKYPDELLLSIISKVNSITELAKKYPLQYRAMYKRPEFKEWSKNLKRQRKSHTVESITVAAKKCKTRTQFANQFRDEYVAAKRLGIFEQVVAHMPVDVRTKKEA